MELLGKPTTQFCVVLIVAFGTYSVDLVDDVSISGERESLSSAVLFRVQLHHWILVLQTLR